MLPGFPRLFNRPEPELDRQPLALEHLCDMGRGVPKFVLLHDAYGALLTVAASRVVPVDAYTHSGPRSREWVIECWGVSGQEMRWSPAQWEAYYRKHLAILYWNGDLTGEAWKGLCYAIAREYPNGILASTLERELTRELR